MWAAGVKDYAGTLYEQREASLGGAPIPNVSPALKHAKGLPHMIYALTTAGRAQKFPRAASVRIILSSVKSDTARLSRAFSVSNSFSRFN